MTAPAEVTGRKPEVLSVSVKEACRITGFGKNAIWRLIAENKVRTFKLGRRTFVLYRSLEELIDPASAQL
jgi:predicted DNA-binding transcriptional regulator AlpA